MKIKQATLTYCSCEYKLCARSSAGVKRCGLLFGAGCHLSLRRTGQIPSIFPGLLPEYLQGQVWAVLADPYRTPGRRKPTWVYLHLFSFTYLKNTSLCIMPWWIFQHYSFPLQNNRMFSDNVHCFSLIITHTWSLSFWALTIKYFSLISHKLHRHWKEMTI